MSLFSGPGIAACNHPGFMNKECGLPEVDVSCIPEACTSIIYDGVFVDLNYHVFGDRSHHCKLFFFTQGEITNN